ncbi:short chain dehydrogenase, partial [Pseudomonas gingeri]|nr:short chain dehydrogenase [Pseudomonas gingeri]
MSDGYLAFVNSPWGRRLAQSVGLPQPLPLQRYRQGQAGNSLNPVVLAAAPQGRLLGELQRIFAATETVPATAASIDAPSTVKVRG